MAKNNHITPQINQLKVGKILRERRLGLGLKLETISIDTKIRIEYLDALENEDYARFTSRTHIKGFLKNYADYLSLDVEKVMALYRRDTEAPKKSVPALNLKADNALLQMFSKQKLWMILGGVLLVLTVILYLGSQVSAILKPPQLALVSPVEVAADYQGELELNAETIEFIGSTDSRTVIRLNNEILKIEADNTFSSPTLPLAGEKTVFILTATNQFGRQSQIELTVAKSQPENSEETEAPNAETSPLETQSE